jgi:hypothetical protein
MLNHRMNLLSFLSVLFSFSLTGTASAALQGSIKIEQLSASTVGTWTLLSEDGTDLTSASEDINPFDYSVAITRFGQTTLSVIPPAGMSVKIAVYRGGDFLYTVDSRQHSFKLLANDNYRFVIQYTLSRFGNLGITSEPSSVRFRMRSPSGMTSAGTTPKTFENLPVGRYILMLGTIEGCLLPARKTIIVKEGERNVVKVTLPCDNSQVADDDIDRSRVSKRTLRAYAEERELKKRGQRK